MNWCPRTREHALEVRQLASMLPPLGCGHLQGASKLAHFRAPFGRTICDTLFAHEIVKSIRRAVGQHLDGFAELLFRAAEDQSVADEDPLIGTRIIQGLFTADDAQDQGAGFSPQPCFSD